ncbi:MAG TPA: DUF748 domain-containing protein [Smithellaceae bacterium]|nr:DUF748 domain-containing protein [Smithellaceae bacterium]
MRLLKKVLIAVLVLIALIGLTGFLILPAVLKPVLTKKISETLHRRATVGQIKINPFDLSATIRGFKLADRETQEAFVAFQELHVNVDVPTSIFRRALILEEIRLDQPYIGVTRNADGTYNFSDLIPKEETQKKEPSGPFLFSLNNIQISNGAADFHDTPNKTNHSIRNLNLDVPFVSNIDYYMKQYVRPKFSAVVNGHTFAVTGETQPFQTSRESLLDIDIRNIDVPFYLQYVPVKMNFKLTQALLDIRLQVHFIMPQKQAPELKLTGRADLKQVSLDDLRGNKILRLPVLSANLASVQPLVPSVHLSEVSLDGLQLAVRRNPKGEINLLNLVGTQTNAKPEETTAEKKKPGKADAKKKQLDLQVDHLVLDGADITFTDEQPARPFRTRIHPLSLTVSNFSLKRGNRARIDLALVMDQKCRITAKGPVAVSPLGADLALGVKNLALRPLQSYMPGTIRMDITGGDLSTAGAFTLASNAKGEPSVKYSGNLSVDHLATIDKERANDFLKWKQLRFESLAAGYNPLFVNIREIALRDFFAKIVIHPGGATNIQHIFGVAQKENPQPDAAGKTADEKTAPAKTPQAAPDAKPSPPPPDIKIGKVSFQGGTVDFADRNIRPNYAVTMLHLQGSVTGLSSQQISRAKVDLKGNLGYGSPLEIAGTINPLAKDFFADIKLNFKDIEMSPVTPYTSKYLGYPITKGKLNFNVAYLVDRRKLTAENKIFFDQLTFGDKVESPEAIKAPVPLAVSLLTDRNGQINLDIPLSGSLDDPKFRIWPIVWQVLVNLITKAVTAPFSLLSSLTGGGEEMSYVEFNYGGSDLPEAGLKKISALSKALYDRPQLKLEIEGYVDAVQDPEALKKSKFDRLLKTQKRKEIIDRGETPAPLEEITIGQAEYEKYLTLAYKAAKFSKPRTVLGIAKDLPPKEMERLLFDNTVVTDADLEQLASRRVQAVREQLLKDGKVEAGRVFIVQSNVKTPAKKEKVKDSRVDFKVK